MNAPIDWPTVRLARRAGQAPATKVAELLQCTQRDAARRIAHALGLECWETADMARRPAAFDRLPLARAQSLRAVLVQDAGGLVAVVHDPLDRDLWTQLAHRAQAPLRFVLASPDDIHAYLNQQEDRSRAVDTLDRAAGDGGGPREAIEELSLATVSDAASPAVRLVNSTLYDALRAGASDVHLESTPLGLAVKYRIDGVLDPVTEVSGASLAEQAVSRLKVLAELDIAERRVPQDGSFRVSAQGREVDLRVSIIPGIHGEDAVIRILDKHAMIEAHGELSLDTLGFEAASVATLRHLMEAAYGMLLVTGPTGAGKTTTLYAALSEIEHRPRQDHHHRRPGRVPVAGRAADPRQRKEGPDLRARAALDPAPRPGQDHGGRNPRSGDRADRRPVRADRPPGLDDRAREQRVRRVRAVHAHGTSTATPWSSALKRRYWAQRLAAAGCARSARRPSSRPASKLDGSGVACRFTAAYRLSRRARLRHCRGTGLSRQAGRRRAPATRRRTSRNHRRAGLGAAS